MNPVDMAASIAPKSDQLNAEDLLGGPVTVTITDVRRGASAEQPVDIFTAEFDRPFKPSKTVRRLLVAAWGADAAEYIGRRMTLFRDPSVRFGGMDVGGIRVSHLSHLHERLQVALTVTRGKRAPYTVEPLGDLVPEVKVDWTPILDQADDAATLDELRALYVSAGISRAPKDVQAYFADVVKNAQDAVKNAEAAE